MATEDVVGALVNELEPVRPLRAVGRRTLVWVAFALSFVAIATWAVGARSDLAAKLGDVAYLRGSALLLLVFSLSARSAFHLSVPGAEPSAGGRWLPILALLAWVFFLAAGPPGTTHDAPAGWPCVARMAGLAFAPAPVVLLMLRRGAPVSPGWTGWFALSSTGSLAMLGTQILCAKDDVRHLFLWHFGPLLATALLGVHLGRWLLTQPRTSPPSLSR